jgi:hypothetical protein
MTTRRAGALGVPVVSLSGGLDEFGFSFAARIGVHSKRSNGSDS